MKQYFLRGLGVGILFTSIVLLVAFGGKEKPSIITDDEIIEKALQLGMVTQEQYLNKTFSDEKIIQMAKELDMVTKEEYENKTFTKDEILIMAEAMGIDFIVAEIEEESQERPDIEDSNAEKPSNDPSVSVVTIVVKKGMTSEAISRKLEEAGIIDDWYGFNQYLLKNKLNGILRIGSFKIEKGASYDKIAKILTKREN